MDQFEQVQQAERARLLLSDAYRALGLFHYKRTTAEQRDAALTDAEIAGEQAQKLIREIKAARRFELRRGAA